MSAVRLAQHEGHRRPLHEDLSPLAGLPALEALDLTGVALARPEQVLDLGRLKKLVFTERLLPPAVRQALTALGVELVPEP